MNTSTIAKQVADLKAQVATQSHNEAFDVFEREPWMLVGLGELGVELLVGSLTEVKICTPLPKETSVTAKLGLLALLEAKPDKGDELGAFLEAGRALAVQEAGTLTWYAFKISDTTYGIFDSFETEEARQAHLSGEIPTALGQVAADLLAKGPDIRTVDVIAVK